MLNLAIAFAAGLFSGVAALFYLLPWILKPTKTELTKRNERREPYRRHYERARP